MIFYNMRFGFSYVDKYPTSINKNLLKQIIPNQIKGHYFTVQSYFSDQAPWFFFPHIEKMIRKISWREAYRCSYTPVGILYAVMCISSFITHLKLSQYGVWNNVTDLY